MHLSELSHPNQLHGLSTPELEAIARQIRERHLEVVSTSGGHLGPGLGVVELTLALYQTLDLDRDKVVWDVGHQAYPHKLITGRYKTFDSLRQKDGVAGYLKRCESRFDHFGAGHASTSISAALGMALARDRRGEDFKCVAVIGDGALTGGMALEAINHAGHLPKTKLLVVLNDNDMSISPPVGALSTYLNRMRLSPPLQFLQGNAEEAIKHLPFLHGELPTELKTLKESMKGRSMATTSPGWCAPSSRPTAPRGPCWCTWPPPRARATPTPRPTRWATTPRAPLIWPPVRPTPPASRNPPATARCSARRW
jgi:1-deoxy-D-xylulose-5-phosphate synthase